MPSKRPLTDLVPGHDRELQPLMVVLEHAQARRDEALARQRQAEVALQRAEDQARQINDYRGECEQRWRAQFRQGAAITLVHCYQGFVERLHGAVDQVDANVQRAQQLCAQMREATVAAELRVASVQQLIERRLHAQGQKQQRRDQKHTDETAARRAWQARAHAQAADTAHGTGLT